MTEPANAPGPGKSTAEAAFNAAKKLIADRNEEVSKIARKLRAKREERELVERRERDR